MLRLRSTWHELHFDLAVEVGEWEVAFILIFVFIRVWTPGRSEEGLVKLAGGAAGGVLHDV